MGRAAGKRINTYGLFGPVPSSVSVVVFFSDNVQPLTLTYIFVTWLKSTYFNIFLFSPSFKWVLQ
ncbi:hypothetical protein CW304_17160 [Bacillus sp. UFRGS-B20]|nr:hypothetical protein CW304_17160 [Bacillus sp. UFRGS-B20]